MLSKGTSLLLAFFESSQNLGVGCGTQSWFESNSLNQTSVLPWVSHEHRPKEGCHQQRHTNSSTHLFGVGSVFMCAMNSRFSQFPLAPGFPRLGDGFFFRNNQGFGVRTILTGKTYHQVLFQHETVQGITVHSLLKQRVARHVN